MRAWAREIYFLSVSGGLGVCALLGYSSLTHVPIPCGGFDGCSVLHALKADELYGIPLWGLGIAVFGASLAFQLSRWPVIGSIVCAVAFMISARFEFLAISSGYVCIWCLTATTFLILSAVSGCVASRLTFDIGRVLPICIGIALPFLVASKLPQNTKPAVSGPQKIDRLIATGTHGYQSRGHCDLGIPDVPNLHPKVTRTCRRCAPAKRSADLSLFAGHKVKI